MKLIPWKPPHRGRHSLARRALVAALAASSCLWQAFSCSSYGKEFRAAATPSLESGVNALLDGFVAGIFAVVEPDADGGEAEGAG